MTNDHMKSRDQNGYDTFIARPAPKPEKTEESYADKQARKQKTASQLIRQPNDITHRRV